MTVGELIEELRKLPQHHPVLIDVGQRYDESISQVTTGHHDSRVGPWVCIRTASDPRNAPDRDDEYNY